VRLPRGRWGSRENRAAAQAERARWCPPGSSASRSAEAAGVRGKETWDGALWLDRREEDAEWVSGCTVRHFWLLEAARFGGSRRRVPADLERGTRLQAN
jgi:hypothetical protein